MLIISLHGFWIILILAPYHSFQLTWTVKLSYTYVFLCFSPNLPSNWAPAEGQCQTNMIFAHTYVQRLFFYKTGFSNYKACHVLIVRSGKVTDVEDISEASNWSTGEYNRIWLGWQLWLCICTWAWRSLIVFQIT